MSYELTENDKALIAEWQAEHPEYSEKDPNEIKKTVDDLLAKAKSAGIKTEYTSEDIEKVTILAERIKNNIGNHLQDLLSSASNAKEQFNNDPIGYLHLTKYIPKAQRDEVGSILKEIIENAQNFGNNDACSDCQLQVGAIIVAMVITFSALVAIAAGILAFIITPLAPAFAIIVGLIAALAAIGISVAVIQLCVIITHSRDSTDLLYQICKFHGSCS